jgi:polyhydroxybutyrate depolymerase
MHVVLPTLLIAAIGLLAPAGTSAAKRHTKQVTTHRTTVHRHVTKTVKKTRSRSSSTTSKASKATGASSGATGKPSTDTHSSITRPGDYTFAVQQDGRTRTYRVHVPPGYTPAEPAPLVVALRAGDGGDGNDFYGLTREADQQGFIALLPDVWRPAGKRVAAGWNAGNCCGTPAVNDVRFVETAVNNVFGQLSISRQHIYAAGMSDGGMMAYRLACELPHVFTAVASVAGTDNTSSCTPDKPVSVLHLHAKNDRRVPFDGGTDPLGQAKVHITSAPQTAAKWAKLDGCGETPEPVLQQAGASCEAYTYCRGRAEVRLCTIDSGGHSWPGALKRGNGEAPSQALSATHAIWAFFSAH